MTPEAQMALVASILPTIAAVGAIWVGLASKRQQKEDSDKQDGKLDHITELTNSTLTAANNRIAELEKIVLGMLKDKTDTAERALEDKKIANAPAARDIANLHQAKQDQQDKGTKKSKDAPPDKTSELVIKEGESAQVTITKTDADSK